MCTIVYFVRPPRGSEDRVELEFPSVQCDVRWLAKKETQNNFGVHYHLCVLGLFISPPWIFLDFVFAVEGFQTDLLQHAK